MGLGFRGEVEQSTNGSGAAPLKDPQPSRGLITQLLHRHAGGDDAAVQELIPLVYKDLRTLAARALRQEREGHTLTPTALVHEAYLRLVEPDMDWRGRGQFFAAAARSMRRILVDHARRRSARKRGGDRSRKDLDDVAVPDSMSRVNVLDLEDALQELSQLHDRQAQVVELRFFAGLSVEEIAEVMGLSTRTVISDWRMARVWLLRTLRAGSE